jgi:hypothetical protein
MLQLFVGQKLSGIEDFDRSRYWIHDLLIKFKVENPKLLKVRSLPYLENVEIKSMDISAESTRDYISNLINFFKFKK